MSRSVNRVTLLGHVGNAPEARTTQSGTMVSKFSLATNRTWKDKTGQKQEDTQWHRCTAFGKLAEIIEQYVGKGDRIYVEGRIEYSTTEGEDGGTRYWTDVVVNELVMLGGSDVKAKEPYQPSGGGTGAGTDDDLPFAPAPDL